MIVYYLRCSPSVTGVDFRPVLPLQPGPQLIGAARRLGPLVDTLVITANGSPAPQGKCRPGTLRPLRRKGGYCRDPLQVKFSAAAGPLAASFMMCLTSLRAQAV